MVRMPPLPVRQDDHPRARLSNHAGDLQPVLPRVLNAPVGNIERPPPAHAENLRRVCGFTGAIFSRAPRAHLALGQVKNARALPALRSLQQSAAAGLLYIVTMRGDGQDVQRLDVERLAV